MRVSRVRRRSRHWVRGARLPDCSAPQLFVDASNDAYWGTEVRRVDPILCGRGPRRVELAPTTERARDDRARARRPPA